MHALFKNKQTYRHSLLPKLIELPHPLIVIAHPETNTMHSCLMISNLVCLFLFMFLLYCNIQRYIF